MAEDAVVAESAETKIEQVYFKVEETSSKAKTEMLRENEELTYTIKVENNEKTLKLTQTEKFNKKYNMT